MKQKIALQIDSKNDSSHLYPKLTDKRYFFYRFPAINGNVCRQDLAFKLVRSCQCGCRRPERGPREDDGINQTPPGVAASKQASVGDLLQQFSGRPKPSLLFYRWFLGR